jgi:magnesium transporter
MQKTVCETANPAFSWIDVVGPSPAELRELAARYGLHAMAVQDCLDPEHLPKYERIGDANFLILRVFDSAAPETASSVQELTRKIAIFSRPELTLTIHRVDLPVVAEVRERFAAAGPETERTPLALLAALVNRALDSYEKPLQHAEDTLDTMEERLFRDGGGGRTEVPSLQRIHVLKRRVNLIKRMLWQTQSVIHRFAPAEGRSLPVYQDLRENAESYFFWADELHEEVHNLLEIYVAMASHRTNEVMRVLTVFSAFFLPLTFLVGVYGMNFRHMPELETRWGYPAALALMLGISLGIFIWFRRRGWLKRPRS